MQVNGDKVWLRVEAESENPYELNVPMVHAELCRHMAVVGEVACALANPVLRRHFYLATKSAVHLAASPGSATSLLCGENRGNVVHGFWSGVHVLHSRQMALMAPRWPSEWSHIARCNLIALLSTGTLQRLQSSNGNPCSSAVEIEAHATRFRRGVAIAPATAYLPASNSAPRQLLVEATVCSLPVGHDSGCEMTCAVWTPAHRCMHAQRCIL